MKRKKDGQRIPKESIRRTEYRLKLIAKRDRVRRDEPFPFLRVELREAGFELLLHRRSSGNSPGADQIAYQHEMFELILFAQSGFFPVVE
jgi:hypothetical protein